MLPQEILDFQAPELDVYARLSEVDLLRFSEPQPGMFLAESAKVIQRALDAEYAPVSFLVEKELLETEPVQAVLSRCPNTPVYTAPKRLLLAMTGYHLTNGFLCAMRRKELPSLKEICAGARRIAVLEDIVNPTNIGAIIRSAAALQMDAVILTAGCCDPLYRRAVRVSMGNVFLVPWTKLKRKERVADHLRDLGFCCVAMALSEDSVSISDERLKREEKLAIFLGTEGEGLAEETIASCQYTAKIPMSHNVDSLNVGAAAAVAFWELSKITETRIPCL